MEYTKGKWETVGNSIYARLPEPEIICYVQGENHKANARLIASAPDLYEACKNLLNAFNLETGEFEYIHSNRLTEAQKALAKAKGEK